MAGKTHGDKIDELEKLVATLVERVDNVREEMVKKELVAVIEERLTELKKTVEEGSRRGFAFLVGLTGVGVGAALTFLGQFALAHLKK